jgi:O-6-methylguanine DNA methyltransferase
MRKLYKHEVETSIGKIDLLSTENGLCYVGLPSEKGMGVEDFIAKNFPISEIMAGGGANLQAAREISEYLDHGLEKFSVQLDLIVSGFYRQVLDQVRSIPYGKTKTYGSIAASLGKPKAARAVGQANGSNPIPIIIPCHRVVAATGLGGYGGGLELKRKLLQMESSL